MFEKTKLVGRKGEIAGLEDHLRDLPADEVSGLCGGLLDDLACLLRSVVAVRGGAPEREPPRTRLLESLGALLHNLARKRPVVLVLDDVHQADPSSWEVLHYLALHYPRTPLLVLGTARPGELAEQPLAVRVLLDLEQQGTLRRLPVEPLGEAEVREMTGDVLGAQAGEDVVDWVLDRSRGNALFAVGLLHTLREEGGTPRPGLRLLPEELTERVRARVGYLDADAHGVLEMLAVAGGRVELAELLRFLGRTIDDLAPSLDRLTRSHLAVEDERGRRTGYEVVHPLIREIIYDGIGGARRFALHRQVVATETEVSGVKLCPGDRVLLNFPAANLDPEQFPDAERVVIDREKNRHIAFGVGIHRCAGSNLARMELNVAVGAFLARIPEFELECPDAVTWAGGQVRGPRNLPLRFA